MLRRTSRDSVGNGPNELTYENVTVNLRGRSASVGDAPVKLTPTEFRLLATLIKEPGRAFTREILIDRAFGHDFEGLDRAVDAHISSLRRKLEAIPPKCQYIHTVYAVGYILATRSWFSSLQSRLIMAFTLVLILAFGSVIFLSASPLIRRLRTSTQVWMKCAQPG